MEEWPEPQKVSNTVIVSKMTVLMTMFHVDQSASKSASTSASAQIANRSSPWASTLEMTAFQWSLRMRTN